MLPSSHTSSAASSTSPLPQPRAGTHTGGSCSGVQTVSGGQKPSSPQATAPVVMQPWASKPSPKRPRDERSARAPRGGSRLAKGGRGIGMSRKKEGRGSLESAGSGEPQDARANERDESRLLGRGGVLTSFLLELFGRQAVRALAVERKKHEARRDGSATGRHTGDRDDLEHLGLVLLLRGFVRRRAARLRARDATLLVELVLELGHRVPRYEVHRDTAAQKRRS